MKRMGAMLWVASVWLIAATPLNAGDLPAKPRAMALLIIDVQEFYFPGGKMPLVEPEAAAAHARELLDWFRQREWTVVHVRHRVQSGGEIHPELAPVAGEKVIEKDEVNAFVGTDLLSFLKSREVEQLVVCGMQTHMCVEAATCAAHDLDFSCIVVSDACATRDLTFHGRVVKARDVHDATLATLSGTYARVVDTAGFLANPEGK